MTAETTLETRKDSLRAEIQASRAEWKSDLHSLTRWMIGVLGSVGRATITGLIVRFSAPEMASD